MTYSNPISLVDRLAHRRPRHSLALAAVLTLATPLAAQMPPPDPPPVQRDLPALSGFSVVPFDFAPPGARALAMGGTFIALADDATAAESNPAGLTQLSRPEISLHGHHVEREIETQDINADVALDQLNRNRTLPGRLTPGTTLANAFATGTRVRFDSEVDDMTFASYVHPSDTYTFSIHYQRATNFTGEDRFRAYDDSTLDLYSTVQEIDVQLDTIGVSAAFKAGDKLSVGFSVRYSSLDAFAAQQNEVEYGADIELGALPVGAPLSAVEALGILDQRIQSEIYRDTDDDITFNVGLLWKPNRRWTLGMVYKDGGAYGIRGDAFNFGCVDATPDPGERCSPNMPEAVIQTFRVPDLLGFGIAWRATDTFKVALDVVSIDYSVLSIGPGDIPELSPQVRGNYIPIERETEIHFGLEKIFFVGSQRTPWTVRAGVYTDPDHDGIEPIDSEDTIYTFGFGTVIAEQFQIDVAAKSSESTEAGVLSMVYRF